LRSCGVELDPEDAQRLNHAKQLRNDVVHYEVLATASQLQAAFIDLFEFAHVFHLRELGDELHPHLDPDLWHVEAALMKKFRAEFVTYQGEHLIKTFPSRIVNAQNVRYYKIGDTYPKRVPYGQESWYPDKPTESNCHDCGVRVGQLHVSTCDFEQCPGCNGQVLSCQCDPEPRVENYPGLFEDRLLRVTRRRTPRTERSEAGADALKRETK